MTVGLERACLKFNIRLMGFCVRFCISVDDVNRWLSFFNVGNVNWVVNWNCFNQVFKKAKKNYFNFLHCYLSLKVSKSFSNHRFFKNKVTSIKKLTLKILTFRGRFVSWSDFSVVKFLMYAWKYNCISLRIHPKITFSNKFNWFFVPCTQWKHYSVKRKRSSWKVFPSNIKSAPRKIPIIKKILDMK